MVRSQRLRLSQVRAMFRLLGEVRELGDKPLVWRRHLVAGLCELTEAQVGMGGEIPPQSTTPTAAVDLGWATERDRCEWLRFMAGGDDSRDPVVLNSFPILRTGRAFSHTRRQVVVDRHWYGTDHFDLRRRAGLDDCILTSVPVHAPGWSHALMVIRPLRDRPFAESDRRLVELCHSELARLWRVDEGPAASAVAALSPRLRQVLSCLLNGDAEKEAAQRLGISRNTLHNHVTALYRHFDVNTRGELFARCRTAPRLHPRLALDAGQPAPFAAARSNGRRSGLPPTPQSPIA